MALIPPRRGEPIINPGGTPTTRFAEYLERSATQVTAVESQSEIDAATINLSTGVTSTLGKRLADIEASIGIQPVMGEDSRIEAMEGIIYSLSAQLYQLQKQIDELKVLL